jgi:hypothetical protein
MRRIARLLLDYRRAFFAALFCVALAAPASASSPQFRRVGTIDAATATANQACYWNGADLECNSTNPTITATGLVGIGTTAPANPLDVVGSVSVDVTGLNTGTAANFLRFAGGGEGIGSKRSAGGNLFGLDFYTASANRMSITNAGNVGIGTTTPLATLDIYRSTSGNALEVRKATSTGGANIFYSSTSDGTNNITGNWGAEAYQWDTFGGGPDGSTPFIITTNGGSERVRVTSTGNVGIGTTSPAYGLELGAGKELRLDGQSALTAFSMGGSGEFQIDAPGIVAGRFVVKDVTGNVGIGSSSPVVSLDLSQKTDAVSLPVGTTGNRPTGVNGMIRYNNTLSALEAYANGAWTSLAGSGALAGSGTTNYVAKWASATSLGIGTLYDDGSGHVGIGTTSPATALDVNGVIVQRPVAAANMNNYLQTNAGAAASTTNLNPGLLVYSNSGARYGMDLGYVGSRYRTRLFAPNSGLGDISFGFHTSGTDPTAQSSITEAMVIRGDTGNVGIGTANPASKLHIIAPNTTYSTELALDTPATSQQSMIGFNSNGTQKWQVGKDLTDDFIIYDKAASQTDFQINSSGDMTLMPVSGNVGIGTTSPSAPLDISYNNTSKAVPSLLLANTNTGAGAETVLQMSVNGSLAGQLTADNNEIFVDSNGGPIILGAVNGNSGIRFYNGGTLLGQFFNNSGLGVGASYAGTTPPANGVIIQGSVGIGTTAPAANVKADINGMVKVAGTGSEPCGAAQVGSMRYNPTGNYFELCSYP